MSKEPTPSQLTRKAPAASNRWIWGCGSAVAFFYAVWCWNSRNYLTADGLSYLDISIEATRNGWGALVNAYWSPLYPLLLAIAQLLIRPPLMDIVPVMHLVNFFVSAATVVAFAFFLRAWNRSETPGPSGAFILFAFAVFLWALIRLHGHSETSPDLCVAGLVFLSAGICFRLPASGRRGGAYLALGATLGFAYHAKTAMFPGALLLLGILAVFPPQGVKRRGLVIAALVFLAVSAPLVTLQSRQLGRLSFGETGTLAYAWLVNGARAFVGWQGEPVRLGDPVHAPRRLHADPEVLEFDGPVSGTYPLWYDPVYWHEGIRPQFHLSEQAQAVKRNSAKLGNILSGSGAIALLAGFLVLYVRRARAGGLFLPMRGQLWMFLWPLGVCAMYLLVWIEARHISAFAALFALGLIGSVADSRKSRLTTVVLLAAALAIVAPVLRGLPNHISYAAASFTTDQGATHDHRAASVLLERGFSPGARLATVGQGIDAYYARLMDARVIAQITFPGLFWKLDPEQRGEILGKLDAIGAEAAVASGIPETAGPVPGWEPIGSTGYYLYDLRAGILGNSGSPSHTDSLY